MPFKLFLVSLLLFCMVHFGSSVVSSRDYIGSQMNKSLPPRGKRLSNSAFPSHLRFVQEEKLNFQPSFRETVKSDYHSKLRDGDTSNTVIKRLCNITGPMKACYKHGASVCFCRGGLANCSGKPYRPNISYAPRLPHGVKCLIFKHNHVQHFDDSFFHNVSSFEVIDFSFNDLLTVSKLTFEIFQGRLKYLLLNFNMGLKYKYIGRVLRYAPSFRLDLINIGLKGNDMPPNFFVPFANITTQEILFDLNYFPHLNLSQFSVLKHVTYLSFSKSKIVTITSASLPLLKGLNLNINEIKHFPKTCSNDTNSRGVPLFPKLEMLYLNSNNISTFPSSTNRCLPSVILLGISRNNVSSLQSFSLANFTSLKVLYMDEMAKGLISIDSNAFSSKSLISLHISKNNINFSSPNISSRLLQGCSRLQVLFAPHNNFANVPPSHFVEIFNIPKLLYLYLGSCRLKYVPSEGLSQMKYLRRLYLYGNEILSLPVGAFDLLTSLQFLRLDRNLIEVVHENVFSQTTRRRLKEIQLGANDFQCTCDLLWFKSWLVEEGFKKFPDYPDGYSCANIPQKLLVNFSLSKQACYFKRSTYILFVVCLSIFLAGFLLFIVFFRYRWHIRLAFYEFAYRYRGDGDEDDGDYQYDVFIIYCNDDSDWVLKELLVKVETQWGHRAFIHERDFQAGGLILDNVVRAMKLSRRIMVVLSSRFTLSNWCAAELKLCQSHIIEHNLPSLLVLQLEPIQARYLTPVLVALRNTTSFLEWPAYRHDVPLFWQRLEKRLKRMLRRQGQRQVDERAVENV